MEQIFSNLEENKFYNFTYKLSYLDDGKEQNDDLLLRVIDEAQWGKFIIVSHKGDDMEDSFELYPEDIIRILPI